MRLLPLLQDHWSSRSIAEKRPDMVPFWHPTKNGALRPQDFAFATGTRLWWKCPVGADHEWQAQPRDYREGMTCPFCTHRRASADNNLATKVPEVAKLWHPTRNGALTPRNVAPGYTKLVWWRCKNGHVWQQSVTRRVASRVPCRICYRNEVKVRQAERAERLARQRLSMARRRSQGATLAEAHPRLAREWHPRKNGKLTPNDVTVSSDRRVWWRCAANPTHEWKATVIHRHLNLVQFAVSGCPFCSHKRVSPETSLATLNPALAAEWHPTKNGKLTPHNITSKSSKKIWWKCAAGPDHEFQVSPGQRTAHGYIARCPYCANRLLSVTNSIAAVRPDLIAEWHPTRNGKLTPFLAIATHQRKKHWWRCFQGHVFAQSCYARITRQGGCPTCQLAAAAARRSKVRRTPVRLPPGGAESGKERGTGPSSRRGPLGRSRH